MSSNKSGSGLKDAKNTTMSLQRTRLVMERNLSRMDAAMRQLSQDGETIKETLDEHAVELKGALSSTHKNLRTVKKAEVWERYSLKAALTFFFTVVFYIVCKRTRILALLMLTLRKFIVDTPTGTIRPFSKERVYDTSSDNNDSIETALNVKFEACDTEECPDVASDVNIEEKRNEPMGVFSTIDATSDEYQSDCHDECILDTVDALVTRSISNNDALLSLSGIPFEEDIENKFTEGDFESRFNINEKESNLIDTVDEKEL